MKRRRRDTILRGSSDIFWYRYVFSVHFLRRAQFWRRLGATAKAILENLLAVAQQLIPDHERLPAVVAASDSGSVEIVGKAASAPVLGGFGGSVPRLAVG
jgi:hypothetical protein